MSKKYFPLYDVHNRIYYQLVIIKYYLSRRIGKVGEAVFVLNVNLLMKMFP